MARQSYSAPTSDQPRVSIQNLRELLAGRIIEPGDVDYDEARTIFYGGFDRRPALIVKAANASDVTNVVSFARDSGMELAVRSGGHSYAGHSATEGGLLLDLSDMKGFDLDIEGRTAWAEAGLTAGELTTKASAHGLAIGFGDTGSVGIGGITLGGGVGYLVRKYGLTIDSLLAADIVTADGKLLRVDAGSHPDLFWAIRGGGGNFGVVTRFQFKLHEVGNIVGGIMILPATPEIIAGFIAESEAAPEEISTIANVMTAPPMPFVPAEYHGQIVLMALMCYAGDAEAGERAMTPFRSLATPIVDMVKPMPYAQIYPPDEAGYHPVGAARSMFINSVDKRMAQTILGHLRASTGMMAVTQLRVLGGAVSRVPMEATAFAHRNSRIMVNIAALYQRPEEAPIHEEWASNLADALNQGDDAVYVNFLGNEGASRVRQAYPGATWDRLAAVKARYDPHNLFRLNHNITPAI